MSKKIIAFYDVLFVSIASGGMLSLALHILISNDFGDAAWAREHWYIVLLFATCISVPITMIVSVPRITIDLSCDKFEAFYLVNFRRNERDMHSNWIIYPSQVESVEVVRLSREEKRRYTSARFLFRKYLKVNFRYGHSKYLYVAHYSAWQIKKIIQLLTSKK